MDVNTGTFVLDQASCVVQSSTKLSTAGGLLFVATLCLVIATLPAQVATPPEAQISNGQLTAKMYLPAAKNG